MRVDVAVNERPEAAAGRQVFFPASTKGLNPAEITLAEGLREAGYATACIGKWHLGDQPFFLPTRQGFDYWFGTPYSNDMNTADCPLPLMRNETLLEQNPDQSLLTRRYTEEALRFMTAHRSQPFFLYLPYNMVHHPLHASEPFRGRSGNGAYGDAVEEVDWSVGRIRSFLRENKIDNETLIIFTSDNGAARKHGGSNLPLPGWKGTTAEGGFRVPCLVSWPGHIQKGRVSAELMTAMDWWPTLLNIAGVRPTRLQIDGENLSNWLLLGKSPKTERSFFYYQKDQLQAIRRGRWKLYLPLDSIYQSTHLPGLMAGPVRPRLYDLTHDTGETTDLASAQPLLVKQMLKKADSARRELGDRRQRGKGLRPALVLPAATCLK